MALTTMYPSKINSPQATLSAQISASATSMTLSDASVLPAAPNICVIGNSTNAEIVAYASISGNVVSGLVRGAGGTTARVWTEGTVVARNFTSLDYETIVSNISTLDSGKANTSDLGDLATQDTVALGSQVTGTLAVSHGGTGQTTISGVKSALSLGTLAEKSTITLTTDVTGALPVANGGTGSTTAANARTALGVKALGTLASLDYTSGYLTNKPTLGGIQVRPNYTISTTDLTAGTSELAEGTIYLVYEE